MPADVKLRDLSDPREQEYTTLSWKLIEWKVAYYLPEYVHSSRRDDVEVSDAEYDKAEVRYLTLCRELNYHNSIVHKSYPGFDDVLGGGMMEVDQSRPSVQLVLHKLSSKKPRKRKRKTA